MKKIIWGIMLLLTGTVSSIAQTKNITVTGTAIEADTKLPILQASVRLLSLPDSTYTAGVATSANGRFTLPKVAAGKYVLNITYTGLHPQHIPVQLHANNLNKNMGTIAMEPDAILLQEAVITAEAPPVTVRADTTEYAASAYRVPEGSMLEELVKKLPGAEVSEDGKITVNGKEIKKIMVDGKEFFTDDPKVAMKNLPVNMVEKVKAYDKKSDVTRITGIDDGEEETVLDLTVKKGMKQGWIGNLIAGYGNKDRYEAGGMLSRFLDNASLSIIGSANNTNNQGFSEFGDAGQGLSGGRAGSGITSAESLGINFAKDTKKLQIGGNIQYGYSDNDAGNETSTERFASGHFVNESNTSRRKRHDARADFRLEWRPDSLTTIIFRPNASYSATNSGSHSKSETWMGTEQAKNTINRKKESSLSESNNLSLNGRLEAFRKLNSKGRNVSLRASFGYSDGDTESDTESDTYFAENNNTLLINRYRDRNSDSRNWSTSASYTEPVFKNHFLQLRYEYAHRKRLSESLVYDNLTDPTVYVDSLSSCVENFYNTHSVDASLRGIHPKMMYSAGIALTPQSSRSETTIGPNSSKQLPTQNVLNFAPQLMFRYMFNKQHMLMLRYRGRSSEPDIESLQQVISQTDPLNIKYGNPNLRPSFSHNVMLFYNKYVPESMRSYAFNMFLSGTQNDVADKITYQGNGGKISEKVNVNGNWNIRGYFSFNTPLKNRKFTISANTNAQYRDARSYNNVGKNTDSKLNTTHSLLLGESLRGSYRANKFDVSLHASVTFNQARNRLLENSNRETYDYFFGGSTNVTLPWDLYVSTDANYRIKNGYSGGFNRNEVIWNAQVSKNLLKNKATLRFKIYDILKEQSNLSRTITNSEMSDNVYNTLGSYFMVHFVYRLNTLGGKSPARQQGFSPGGGRGPRGSYGGGPGGSGGRF